MVQERQENSVYDVTKAVTNLIPVSVDDQQRCIVSGLPTLQLLNVLPQLIFNGLALVKHLCKLPVLGLQGSDVQLLLGTGTWDTDLVTEGLILTPDTFLPPDEEKQKVEWGDARKTYC